MSATPDFPRTITAKYAHDAVTKFGENSKLGGKLATLRDEAPARTITLRKNLGSVNLTVGKNLEAVLVQLNGKEVAAACQASSEAAGAQPTGKGHQGNVEKRRRTSENETATEMAAATVTETATHLEAPIPLPAHHQQSLQPLLRPTPAPTPPTVTSETQVGEPPIHGPATALGSAADHWLDSLALSKYAPPVPTHRRLKSTDYAPSSGHPAENNDFALSQASLTMRGHDYALSQAPVIVRGNDYAPSPTPFKGNMNDDLDHDTSKPMLAYLPRNVSPEVLRSTAQYHQDLADDLRMEAKRLEKEMRQEREREREWGARAARQARYE